MIETVIENYRKCYDFFVECRWFFVGAFGLFALTFLIGFAFPIFFREEILDMLRLLILELDGLGTLKLIWFIFLNNLQASFFAMMFGIFLGLFPLLVCVLNGYLLGFVAHEAVAAEGILMMWRILPHGIFELPAVLFSIGIGMRLGFQVVGSRNRRGTNYLFREGLRFFAFVIFPLLIIAGIIEGMLIGLVG